MSTGCSIIWFVCWMCMTRFLFLSLLSFRSLYSGAWATGIYQPRCEVLRTARSCAPAPPPLLPRAAASRDASLLLACLPRRPCPEARLRAPRCCSPRTGEVTEIESERIPVRPSAPPRHPAPASISVGRRQARGFPPGQSPSPLMGAVPRPTLGSRVSP